MTTALSTYTTNIIQKKVNHARHSDNLFQRHISSRCGHLFLVPTSIIIDAVDTLKELAFTTLNTLTLNQISSFKEYAKPIGFTNLIASPYLNLLNSVNPNAEFEVCGPLITGFAINLFAKTNYLKTSKNFILREIVTRLSAPLMIVASTICLLADFILGVTSAFAAFFTLGLYKSINSFALGNLAALSFIPTMISQNLVTIVNPHEKRTPPTKTVLEV